MSNLKRKSFKIKNIFAIAGRSEVQYQKVQKAQKNQYLFFVKFGIKKIKGLKESKN